MHPPPGDWSTAVPAQKLGSLLRSCKGVGLAALKSIGFWHEGTLHKFSIKPAAPPNLVVRGCGRKTPAQRQQAHQLAEAR